jgi:hypothetical protein
VRCKPPAHHGVNTRRRQWQALSDGLDQAQAEAASARLITSGIVLCSVGLDANNDAAMLRQPRVVRCCAKAADAKLNDGRWRSRTRARHEVGKESSLEGSRGHLIGGILEPLGVRVTPAAPTAAAARRVSAPSAAPARGKRRAPDMRVRSPPLARSSTERCILVTHNRLARIRTRTGCGGTEYRRPSEVARKGWCACGGGQEKKEDEDKAGAGEGHVRARHSSTFATTEEPRQSAAAEEPRQSAEGSGLRRSPTLLSRGLANGGTATRGNLAAVLVPSLMCRAAAFAARCATLLLMREESGCPYLLM